MAKIIVFGMSCVGKTTYAKSLGIPYYCFDYLFPWNFMETFPEFSIERMLEQVIAKCEESPSYVLDGWHLADIEGNLIPNDCEIHVLYDNHKKIIERYRVPVLTEDEHLGMYKEWYGNIKNGNNYKFYKVRKGKSPQPTTYEYFCSFCQLQ